jgi:hypothetical protein
MPTGRSHFESNVNKKVTIATGILLFATGAPFLILGAVGILKLTTGDLDQALLVIIVLSALVGAFCCWTGTKMVLGIRRKDGGLLSPAVFRTGGALFLLVPIALLLTEDELSFRSVWMLIELGFYVAVAGACFRLANRRQFRTLDQETAENDI